ncbi:MAG TPA: GNAT family N-acetyltransferase, partial [Acidimicrobiia bacterium]|nr:GNAT family N-acetyltransferase [Acidimicrobiia bacterium]
MIVRDALAHEYERVGELTIAAYRALPVDHLWDGYDADILDVATRAKVAHVLVAVEGDDVLGA